MLEIARKKIEERNLGDRIQLKQMGATEMDKAFDDETFDKIVSTVVFGELHSDEQRYALRESYRVLKLGGLIIVADEIRPKSLAKRILHSLVRIPLVAITYILTQTSTRPVRDMEDLMTGAGFQVIYRRTSRRGFFGLCVARKGPERWDSMSPSEQS